MEYEERVLRYRVLRRMNLHPEKERERIASLLLHGIDPRDNWELVWSFETLEAAEKQAASEREYWKEPNYTIAVKDAGGETVFKRSGFF